MVRRSSSHSPTHAYRLAELTRIRGSPLPDQNARGSWKPGISGNADHAPLHCSAGVGGMLILSGGVMQRMPPRLPRRVVSALVQERASGGKAAEYEAAGKHMSARQMCDSWWKPAVTRRDIRMYFGPSPGEADEDQCGNGMMAGLKNRIASS